MSVGTALVGRVFDETSLGTALVAVTGAALDGRVGRALEVVAKTSLAGRVWNRLSRSDWSSLRWKSLD